MQLGSILVPSIIALSNPICCHYTFNKLPFVLLGIISHPFLQIFMHRHLPKNHHFSFWFVVFAFLSSSFIQWSSEPWAVPFLISPSLAPLCPAFI